MIVTIYLDNECKCHVTNDGTMSPYETNFFDGKCPTYIEGYCIKPAGVELTVDGKVYTGGEMIFPWKPMSELERAQLEYELEQLKAELADADAALEVLGVTVDA